jgi:uncharacterized protein YqjF (DUF2071 family)
VSWRQTWHELGFLHWRVEAARLRSLIPFGLTLEEFDGSAWVAVTPFWMSGVTLRGMPALPFLSRFAELNTRTYVARDGISGVWFFSLDAASRLAVLAARALFHLPYHFARMSHQTIDGVVHYRSHRPGGPHFEARYAPKGPKSLSQPGTVEHWLTERYCLYASRAGRLYRAPIQHVPWPLQVGEAEIEGNQMLTGQGIPVGGPPQLVHYAERLEVLIGSPVRVDSGESGAKA